MTRPGQGCHRRRRGSLFSPNGMGVTWSSTFLPPPGTGRSTASCPSSACTRRAARATRSLMAVSPHSASCCPVARTTWSGVSRSSGDPARPSLARWEWARPVGSVGSVAVRRLPAVELPADPFGDRGRGQQAVVPPPPAALLPVRPGGRDLHADAGQPAGGQAVVQPFGERLGREHHRLGPRLRRVELLGHGQVRGRRAGGQRPGVQAAGQPVRGLSRVAEPAGHVAGGQRGEIPERAQAQPGQQAGQVLAGSARTLTGWAARNSAVPPGGTTVTGTLVPAPGCGLPGCGRCGAGLRGRPAARRTARRRCPPGPWSLRWPGLDAGA